MYVAILDYDRRIVRLGTCSGYSLEFSHDPPRLVMLSCLYSLVISPVDLGLLPVFRDFLDLFMEVTDLPTYGEIDFRIYLVENARPVAFPLRHTTIK